MSHRDQEAGAWGRILFGPRAVPFGSLPIGARFTFPGSTVPYVTTSARGWYRGPDGRRWRTGRLTAVLPEALREGRAGKPS